MNKSAIQKELDNALMTVEILNSEKEKLIKKNNKLEGKNKSKNYKIKIKKFLYEVSLETGSYSDWSINYYIFSGKNDKEVWEFIKIWAVQGGITTMRGCKLSWNNKIFQFKSGDKDMTHNIDVILEVNINKLYVIYVDSTKLID